MADDVFSNAPAGKFDLADWPCDFFRGADGVSPNPLASGTTANGLDSHLLLPDFGHYGGDARWNGDSIAASVASQ